MTRRAKIVCTLGPASGSAARIRELVEAGMDIARLNFSHGTHDEHGAAYRWVREASDAAGRAVGVLADLQGPKIRLGTFAGGAVTLRPGAEFRITTEPVLGTSERASTDYPALARDVRPGAALLIDDGTVRLEALAADGREVRTRVLEGGTVGDHKGINLPGVAVSAPTLTEKDRADLAFALELRVDFIALSFVRRPEDAAVVREAIAAAGAALPVFAKLEKPEAVERLEAVVQSFDGVLVARGDLGVEMPLERVPLVQRRALRLAREAGKPAIVATQMLDSMVHRTTPTRAEASDVAHAVWDGADALMLSAETSVGEHPVESVRTMARLVAAAEEELEAIEPLRKPPARPDEALARAAVGLANDVAAAALVAFTASGATARRMASLRQRVPLLAFTSDPAVRSRLALTWGVETFVVPAVSHTDDMVRQVDRAMLELGRARRGDQVVIVAGTPPGVVGSTNTMRLHRLGMALESSA
jgi:pyruvate kinase